MRRTNSKYMKHPSKTHISGLLRGPDGSEKSKLPKDTLIWRGVRGGTDFFQSVKTGENFQISPPNRSGSSSAPRAAIGGYSHLPWI